jgi:hypothetical protein
LHLGARVADLFRNVRVSNSLSSISTTFIMNNNARCRIPFRSFFAALLLALVATFGAALPKSAHAFRITPFITCIEPFEDGSGFIANFGYESFEPSPIQILVGVDNFFSPLPEDRNQPTVFLPGYFERAFRIHFLTSTANPTLRWSFLDNKVFATDGVKVCPDTQRSPPPIALTLTSGGNQVANVNAAFAAPVVVTAKANGFPIRGVTLKATAPASGASAIIPQSVATTDANGVASFSFTANATIGSYNVAIAVGTSATPVSTITVPLRNQ